MCIWPTLIVKESNGLKLERMAMGQAGTDSLTRILLSIWACSVVVALAAIVYLIPAPIDPEPYMSFQPPPKLVGVLSPNTKLQHTNKLFPNTIIGPESFAADNQGHLYTGTYDGKVWEINTCTQQARIVTQTGTNLTNCGLFEHEPACGRAKGMVVHPDGYLYVAEAYRGLLRINVTTGGYEIILNEINGVPFKFMNGMDITREGVLYFTDSTTKWDRRNYRYEVIETNHLGRLIEYNPRTRKARKLLDNLYLANGVALSDDETFLIIAEMSICRLTKYYLKGPKTGHTEVFYDNLPGYPDNIKRTSRGTFYVGIGVARFQKKIPIPPFLDLVAPYPALKKIVAKTFPFSAYNLFLPRHSLFLELDREGQIIRSFHDPDGTTMNSGISEAFELDGHVYLGHFSIPFLGQVPLEYLLNDQREG